MHTFLRKAIIVLCSAFFVAFATIGGTALAAPAAQLSQPSGGTAGIHGFIHASGTGGVTVAAVAHGYRVTNAKGQTLVVVTDGTPVNQVAAESGASPTSAVGGPIGNQQSGWGPPSDTCWTGSKQQQISYYLEVNSMTYCDNFADVELDMAADYCPVGGWDENVNNCIYGGGWTYFALMNPYGCLMNEPVPYDDLFCPSQYGWATSSIAYPRGFSNHGSTQFSVAISFSDGGYVDNVWMANNPQYFP